MPHGRYAPLQRARKYRARMAGKQRAHMYVDGLNLYYAIRDTPYKWLDLEALADRLLPAHDVTRVVYCTARVISPEDDPNLHLRQSVYLRALQTRSRIDILEGHFKVNPTRMGRLPQDGCACCGGTVTPCRCCRSKTVPVLKREEKGSDVQLAVQLVRDALVGQCEVAFVISGDADLQPAIDTVRELTEVRVIVSDPRNREDQPLRGHERRTLRETTYAACQLPEEVVTPGGAILRRPDKWLAQN